MYDIKQSDNWEKNYSAKRKPGQDGDPCIVCGKRTYNPKHYVRLFWGYTAVMHIEALEIIAREGYGGDMMYYPVGTDCLRKQPELRPYVEDAKLHEGIEE